MKPKNRITKISVEGYRSLKSVQDLELGDLNILVGPNGSGKSNFIGFFRLLGYALGESLQVFIQTRGFGGSMLFMGAKNTPVLRGGVEVEGGSGISGYDFTMAHTESDTLVFTNETLTCHPCGRKDPLRWDLEVSGRETAIIDAAQGGPHQPAAEVARIVRDALSGQRIYQFHDTSSSAHARQTTDVSRNRYLAHDAGNLSAVLYDLKVNREPYYQRIRDTVRRVVPGFKDFILDPETNNPTKIMLRWQGADPAYEFNPHHISDGSLRFMALATLLLLPEDNLPDMIIIDEPELGMHPDAEELVAALIQSVSVRCQVIVATQSATFLDSFDPDNVIVTEMKNGATSLKRQSAESLGVWLERYSLGEVWQKNLLGGLP